MSNLDVLFFKIGSDVCYISFADALQADWFKSKRLKRSDHLAFLDKTFLNISWNISSNHGKVTTTVDLSISSI